MSYLSRVLNRHKQISRALRRGNPVFPESLFYFEEAERIVHATTCFYCDVAFTKPDGKHNPTGKTADHIIVRSQKGIDHPVNYVAACGHCNQTRDVTDFVEFAIASKLRAEYSVRQAVA